MNYFTPNIAKSALAEDIVDVSHTRLITQVEHNPLTFLL